MSHDGGAVSRGGSKRRRHDSDDGGRHKRRNLNTIGQPDRFSETGTVPTSLFCIELASTSEV